MFVHAHPDDESSKGAATMAKLADAGHRVSVVTLTDGSAGEILNPKMDRPGVVERLQQIRREELTRALEILGVTDHVWFGYRDSGFVADFDGDGSVLADEAFYPHPDHIRCHDVAAAAFDAAGDPQRYPAAGAPWTPSKLYYTGVMSRTRMLALHQGCVERGLDSPFARWLERLDFDEPDPSTTHVRVADWLGRRRRALLAHATQIDPDGPWFKVPDELIAEVYPYEDFTLARSRVATSPPEASLLDGLAETDAVA
ncbi:MAG: mycothiol conjugate amidase Mca [Actinobacteria bacterium QS_5_72_10]|nr:MAG: mycothiol conjugate amidase Mca [Actinobacteria bacterium QS_5_72_10]